MERFRSRKAQSLMEVLIGIGIGALFIIGAVGIIAPSLRTNTQVAQVQTRAQLASDLLSNVKSWATENWAGLLSLATGTGNAYYLNTTSSPFTISAATSSGGGATFQTVAFDAVGPGVGGISTSSNNGAWSTFNLTWNHVVTSTGSNTLLVVGVAFGPGNNDPGVALTATYSGAPMTSAGMVHTNNQTAGFVQMFYLVAPLAGTHAVVVTAHAGSAPSASDEMIGGSVSFTGVSQSTPFQSATTTFGSGTTPSITIPSQAGDMVIDAVANGSAVSNTNQTLRWENNLTGANGAGNGAQSTAAGATSVTMGYTVGGDWWGIIAMDVNQAGLIGSPPGYSGTSTESIMQTTSGGKITYNRYFYVSDVYRDIYGNVTTTMSGNYYDPSTKLVTVVVAASTTPASAPTIASAYLTRNANSIVNQISWAGGIAAGPVTMISNKYAALSSVVVNATGSLQLANPPGGTCTL